MVVLLVLLVVLPIGTVMAVSLLGGCACMLVWVVLLVLQSVGGMLAGG